MKTIRKFFTRRKKEKGDTALSIVMDVNSLEEEIGDMTFVRDLIRETISDVSSKMAKIDVSVTSRDYRSILIDAHSIKGVALTMKCADLASASSSLENLVNGVIRNTGTSRTYERAIASHASILKHEVERLEKFESTYEKN